MGPKSSRKVEHGGLRGRPATGSAIIELMDRRGHGVWVGVFGALGLLAVVGACGGTSQRAISTPSSLATGSTEPTSTTSSGPVALSVVECPTSRGISGTPPAAYPSTIAVSLDPATAEQVAYYSDDTRSLLPIMGPKGWDCSTEVGADGSTVVAVFPSSESKDFSGNNLYPQPFTASSDEAVVAYSPSACQGCISGLVCPLIPNADQQIGHGTYTCNEARPSAEAVDWLNGSPNGPIDLYTSDQVGFEDPPGVAGDGTPSGGDFPANGVITYTFDPSSEAGATSMTCTLPANDHSVCTAALNDFTTRNWPLGNQGG